MKLFSDLVHNAKKQIQKKKGKKTMKQTKKFVSILLALCLTLTFSVMAFAAESGTITLTNAKAEAEYTAYKIFDLSYAQQSAAYTYTINSSDAAYNIVSAYAKNENAEGVNNGMTLTESTNGDYVVTVDEDVYSAASFAAYLKANIDSLGDGIELTNNNSGTASASNLELGYYFVDSTLGSLCALTSTDIDAEIQEKNEEPTITKEVKEDNGGEWDEKNDAAIDETVDFRATITAKGGAENYIMHDKMGTGLTFDETSVAVTLNSGTVDPSNYTVKTTDLTDDCTFEVVFAQNFCSTLKDNDAIVVTYSATVDNDAVIAGVGNPNTVKMSYGESSEFETEESQTITYVWNFNIFKHKENATQTNALAGATFQLAADETGNTVIKLIKTSTDKNIFRVATGEEITVGTDIYDSFTTSTTGTIKISGLDEGTYYVVETAAPEGYNALTEPVKVIIDHAGNVKDSEGEEAVALTSKTVNIQNNTGTVLPETGGIGTTIFYILGGLLAVGAVILLVTKKRMSLAENAE